MTLQSKRELIQAIRRVYRKATTMCVVLSVLCICIDLYCVYLYCAGLLLLLP
jgi:hypothetical protein